MKSIFCFCISVFFHLIVKSQVCFLSNFGNLGDLYKTSNNYQTDKAMTSEYTFLTQKFGVYPDLYYYNDANSKNAFATKNLTNNSFPDGTVAIGFNLIKSECSLSTSGTCVAVAIVMAHEFAHIVAFKYNIPLTGKYAELFADYMAGCYMHLRSIQFGYTNVEEAARSFFNTGDYQFNSPNHHGTPNQRLACLMAGYNFSYNVVQSGYTYNLNDAVTQAVQYINMIQ